jgi:hypothetical protein
MCHFVEGHSADCRSDDGHSTETLLQKDILYISLMLSVILLILILLCVIF